MRTSKEDLQIKYQGFRSLFYLSRYILGYDELQEKPHREMCNVAQKKNVNILELEPRGHFKTTIFTISKAISSIINNPDIRILIVHKIFTKARDIMREIKGHFEKNEKFRYYYGGDWHVSNTWGTEAIVVSRRKAILSEPTISISSTDHEVTGGHFDLIILDDPVGLKDMYSEAERNKTLRFFSTLEYLLDPGGQIICVGTRWHLKDLWNYIIENEKDFIIRVKTAELPNGKPYFPQRFSIEKLRRMRNTRPIMYAAQMMNNPQPQETQIYNYNDLNFYQEEKRGGIVYAYMDPALSKKASADYTSIIIGQKSKDRIYIPYCYMAQVDPETVKIKAIEICKKFKVRKLGIESNAFQEILVNDIKKEMKKQRVSTDIVSIKHSNDKQLRINSMHGKIINDVYFLESWDKEYPLLISQLVDFPQAEHDDGPDSLEGLVSMFESIKEVRMRWV